MTTRAQSEVFSVELTDLRDSEFQVRLSESCMRLARTLAARHGIEDPEEEWLVETSVLLETRMLDGLEWECVRSPAAWKADLAAEDQQIADDRARTSS